MSNPYAAGAPPVASTGGGPAPGHSSHPSIGSTGSHGQHPIGGGAGYGSNPYAGGTNTGGSAGYPPPNHAPQQQQQHYGQQQQYPPPASAPYGSGYPPQHQHHHQQQAYGGYPQPQQHAGSNPYTATAPPPPQPPQHAQNAFAPPSASLTSTTLTYNGVSIPAPSPPAPPLAALPGFDVQAVVERLYKAMKGFGTDEKSLIAALAPLDAFQVEAVRNAYVGSKGKGLVEAIEKETSRHLEEVLRAKALGPLMGDVVLLRRATKGAGTDERALTHILLSRSNEDVLLLKQAFQATYGVSLEKVVKDELSFQTERLFTIALSGTRAPDTLAPTPQQTSADVAQLYAAMRGAGTDELAIYSLLLQRNDAQLVHIAHEYARAHGKPLSLALAGDFSGHMKDALLYVVRGAEGCHLPQPQQRPMDFGVARDALLLHEAMKGAGTDDRTLVRTVVRAHWNRMRWAAVKAYYAQHYISGGGLEQSVKKEVSFRADVHQGTRFVGLPGGKGLTSLSPPLASPPLDRTLRARRRAETTSARCSPSSPDSSYPDSPDPEHSSSSTKSHRTTNTKNGTTTNTQPSTTAPECADTFSSSDLRSPA